MEDLRWLDFVIVFVYFVLVAWIGFRFSRRQNSTETYFAARRSIPHWAMGVSMFATLISSITFIAYPGSAYAGTWSELYPMFMILIVLLLVGTVIVPPALLGLLSIVTFLANCHARKQKLPVQQTAWYTKKLPTFSDALALVKATLLLQQYFPTSLFRTHVRKPHRPRPIYHYSRSFHALSRVSFG